MQKIFRKHLEQKVVAYTNIHNISYESWYGFSNPVCLLVDCFVTPDVWAIKHNEVKFTSSALSETACQEFEIPELAAGVKNFKYWFII